MLVYLREAERGRILAGGDLEVPRRLKQKFDLENDLKGKMKREYEEF